MNNETLPDGGRAHISDAAATVAALIADLRRRHPNQNFVFLAILPTGAVHVQFQFTGDSYESLAHLEHELNQPEAPQS